MADRNGSGLRSVGEWAFDADSGELRRGGEVRRLEPRAAKALEMLCVADGAIVSQEQLIAGVWNGRSLSENSVAVVIGQLRRALDDDKRPPRLIETIPKRGYRIVKPTAGRGGRGGRRLQWAAFAVLLLIAAALLLRSQQPERPSLLVGGVANVTGDKRLDAHARATGELLVDRLSRRGFAVRRSGAADFRIESKLVIWNGAPWLGITAVDGSGAVTWSAMVPGAPAQVPAQVDGALDRFDASLENRAKRP